MKLTKPEWQSTCFNLYEALDTIATTQAFVYDLEKNQNDDAALAVHFEHIQSHLNLAWNQRGMSTEDRAAQSQKEYESQSRIIPNFGGRFRMVDWAQLLERRWIVTEYQLATIQSELEKTGLILTELLSLFYPNEHHDLQAHLPEHTIAAHLSKSTQALCLAWHLRNCKSDMLKLIPSDELDVLRFSIPDWDLSFTLARS